MENRGERFLFSQRGRRLGQLVVRFAASFRGSGLGADERAITEEEVNDILGPVVRGSLAEGARQMSGVVACGDQGEFLGSIQKKREKKILLTERYSFSKSYQTVLPFITRR